MKLEKVKLLISSLLIFLSIVYINFFPKAKYEAKSVVLKIMESIPLKIEEWQGRDIEVKEDLKGEIYNFIGKILVREYFNFKFRTSLFFICLDAGNFHYPKVCLKGSGFTTEELTPVEFKINSSKIKAHLVYFYNSKQKFLSIYWICINKRVLHTWTEQKIRQLFYSLFNKKRVGLMIRIDTPLVKDIQTTLNIVEDFLKKLYNNLPKEEKEYIFGMVKK